MKRKFQVSLVVVAGLLMAAVTASAQTTTTGAVRGIVTDKATGDAVAGATVIATGPALQGQQAEITDSAGFYFLANLPPGAYQVTVYYAEAKFTRTNVPVQLGKVAKVNIGIDTQAGKGEVIEIKGRAPIIDQGSTKTGVTITQDYTNNIPTGRTFGAVMGSVAGAGDDLYGISFSGSSSLENTYVVEGINTTDPAYGEQSSNLPNEFVRETEIISGGYAAEYGRSTGGVVSVLTKTGGNEFHGSVFTYFTPGALVADEEATPRAGSAIDSVSELSYQWDIGAELGGPIVKDKLWFHAGINPSFYSYDQHRLIKTQVDRNNDGMPDVDENGFTILEEVDRYTQSRSSQTYYFTGKITGAVSPDHQGNLSVWGNPQNRNAWADPSGVKSASGVDIQSGAVDVAGKWTSKFNDNKTQVDAVVGYHWNRYRQLPNQDLGNADQVFYYGPYPLEQFADYENADFNGVPQECLDDVASDPYPGITNCPVQYYDVRGYGFREKNITSRTAGNVSVTQRVKAAGHHSFKAGIDVELQTYDHLSDFTGGSRYRELTSGLWRIDQWYTVSDTGLPCGVDLNGDGEGDAMCAYQPHGISAETNTRNLGAYLQDSWSILPNLTLNAGLRWEQQTLYTGKHLQGEISPLTGEPIPKVAFDLKNMFAPRLGVIYDWTKEGRSKVFAHWGRFYESMPMDINFRAFGGEVYYISYAYPPAYGGTCDPDPNNLMGTCNPNNAEIQFFSGSGDTLYTPGLKAQYLDEWGLGTEYEVMEDLKLGLRYQHRALGRIIEDISTDAGNTYVIANPGEIDQADIDDVWQQAADARAAGDDARADQLEFYAYNFEAVAFYDKGNRRYDAVEASAEKRFTRDLMVKASYTYSKLKGNFPGLFSPETGQEDPNLTSMFDMMELMANRYGDLSADRPHSFKLDGYYRLRAGNIGQFTFGARARATSGVPQNYTGAHKWYGPGEVYILPRGSGGRLPFTTRFDGHIAYGRDLGGGRTVEAFVDIFNLFNQQPEVTRDVQYTFDSVNAIVGGDQEDLRHLKVVDYDTELTLPDLAGLNPNYNNASSRQAPMSIRFGARLFF